MALASTLNRPRTPPVEAARNRSSPGKVTGKLLIAMNAMVWQGLPRKDAAALAGLSEHSLYISLRKPHIRQWYLGELEVLRTSEKARNIHRAIEIRDAANNKPAIDAMHYIDGSGAEQGAAAAQNRSPGIVFIVNTNGAAHTTHMREIDGKSLISQEVVSHDEAQRDE